MEMLCKKKIRKYVYWQLRKFIIKINMRNGDKNVCEIKKQWNERWKSIKKIMENFKINFEFF